MLSLEVLPPQMEFSWDSDRRETPVKSSSSEEKGLHRQQGLCREVAGPDDGWGRMG